MIYLATGEWWQAWIGMSITFLVASLGVVGLGWYVLRADAQNRKGEEELDKDHSPPHH